MNKRKKETTKCKVRSKVGPKTSQILVVISTQLDAEFSITSQSQLTWLWPLNIALIYDRYAGNFDHNFSTKLTVTRYKKQYLKTVDKTSWHAKTSCFLWRQALNMIKFFSVSLVNAIKMNHFLRCRICRNRRPPEISVHQKHWFFKGGSTQNRWLLMGDFSKGGVHKTVGYGWVLECFLLI